LKNLLISIFLSLFASAALAQSSSISKTIQLRADVYCALSSGDGWEEFTFSKTPGKLKVTPGQHWPVFKDEYFSMGYELGPFEHSKMRFKDGTWSALVKDRTMFKKISDKEIKRCLKELGYDKYFQDARKPSELFSRRTLKVSYKMPAKIKRQQ
jgi:hypothetical protein